MQHLCDNSNVLEGTTEKQTRASQQVTDNTPRFISNDSMAVAPPDVQSWHCVTAEEHNYTMQPDRSVILYPISLLSEDS